MQPKNVLKILEFGISPLKTGILLIFLCKNIHASVYMIYI